jgi:hypothetical protein
MKGQLPGPERPDIEAATRGGDWSQGMEEEGTPQEAGLELAMYWRQIYHEILCFEESVLARMQESMIGHSKEARREIERTNVPVVVAQVEKFRQRHGYWSDRVRELESSRS